jgi:signal transduction histidine kinase
MAEPQRELESVDLSPRQTSRDPLSVAIAYCLLIGIVCFGFIVAVENREFMARDLVLMPLFATASLVILLGMAGLYFYAYQFYRDGFYALLAIGWVTNATYIFLEGFFRRPVESGLAFNIYIYLYSLLTFVPFYIASFKDPGRRVRYKRALTEIVAWLGWIVLTLYGGLWLTTGGWAILEISKTFFIVTCGGIPYAVWTLVRVGRSLKQRLSPEIHGSWAQIFPATFYIYAALQPLYILKLTFSQEGMLIVAFFPALLTKVLNSISALSIVLRDFASLKERLESRSVLEDLGALTASIRHDITNPLAAANTIIHGMESKFQASPDVIADLKKVEEQNQRIYATTEIISMLRGGKDFYERFMDKTSLPDLVRRSVKAVQQEMRPVNIHFKLPEKVLYTKAYRPMLQQALVNVLRNAVEAIGEANRNGGVIIIDLKETGDERNLVVIEVQDNGCGIPESDIPKLTTLFSTKGHKKPNSGIGLFISDRIVRFHNGRLRVSSREGVATTVSILLPRWTAQQ